MKALVLVAGCLGAIGFFEPFFDYRGEPVSAYRIASGFDAEVIRSPDRETFIDPDSGLQMIRVKLEQKTSPIPFYFLSAIVFLLAGFAAIVVGRFSGFVALITLSGALLALGGYMHEVNLDRRLVRAGGEALLSHGATLLLVSGLLGLVASIVVLVKREPAKPKPPKPPPELPVARVIS
jgi:hypothetical protein